MSDGNRHTNPDSMRCTVASSEHPRSFAFHPVACRTRLSLSFDDSNKLTILVLTPFTPFHHIAARHLWWTENKHLPCRRQPPMVDCVSYALSSSSLLPRFNSYPLPFLALPRLSPSHPEPSPSLYLISSLFATSHLWCLRLSTPPFAASHLWWTEYLPFHLFISSSSSQFPTQSLPIAHHPQTHVVSLTNPLSGTLLCGHVPQP
jgi:hypothetical protein